MTARNDLGSLEEWTGTKRSLPHIPGHVGVTDEAIASLLGHRELSKTRRQKIPQIPANFFSFRSRIVQRHHALIYLDKRSRG